MEEHSKDTKRKWRVKVWLKNEIDLQADIEIETTERFFEKFKISDKYRLTYEPIDT